MKFSLEDEYGITLASNGRAKPVVRRPLVADPSPPPPQPQANQHFRNSPLVTPAPPKEGSSATLINLSAPSLVDPQRCATLDRIARSIVPTPENFRQRILKLAREALLFHCPSIPVDELVEGVATVTELSIGPNGAPRYTEPAELSRQVHICALEWLRRQDLLLPHRANSAQTHEQQSVVVQQQPEDEMDPLSREYEERIASMWNRRDAAVMVAVPQFRPDGSVLVIGIVRCSPRGVFRWQLGIGNRISAELVQLSTLQHLRLVQTQIVLRDESAESTDGSVTTTTSLELSSAALRAGTQYTVWLICLDGGREFSDLQTFFVP